MKWLWTIVGLLTLLPGCQFFSLFQSAHIPEIREKIGEIPGERAVIDYRLIDQPAGDSFANQELWKGVRDPLPHELSALLAENGIRVGVVTGLIPHELTERMTSDRYAIDPRAIVTKLNDDKVIPVNGPVESQTTHFIKANHQSHAIQGKEIECGLKVTVIRGNRESILVRCQLVMQKDAKQAWLRPNDDRTQFVWNQQKSIIETQELTWELPLERGDYLIIGPTAQSKELTGTLGELFFFTNELSAMRQRFLMVRGHFNPGPAVAGRPLQAIADRVK